MSKIHMIDPKRIVGYKQQLRADSEPTQAFLRDIKRNGILTPLQLSSALRIWDGCLRLKAAKILGMKKVPCYIAKKFELRWTAANYLWLKCEGKPEVRVTKRMAREINKTLFGKEEEL